MTKRNIVHVEIPAADLAKAGQFYKDLFGWEIQPIPEMNYTMWDAGDGSAGGFNPLGPEVKPGDILIYINSDDIEADLKKAKSLGGTIVREKDEIPQTGWFGMFKDPTGNVIALYTSMNPGLNKE
ncbi:MAG: VOC family protein [Chloroflexi bacterium]|nr:VOC family protein [Chloroflexota bacterium]